MSVPFNVCRRMFLAASLAFLSAPVLAEAPQKLQFTLDWRFEGPSAPFLLAKAKGYSLDELLGGREVKVKVAGTKVKAKYRHPANPELQWTGRGRQPKWVAEWLAGGNALEALVI